MYWGKKQSKNVITIVLILNVNFRGKVINNIRRILNEVSSTDEQEQKVVYDLDELIVMDKMLGNGGNRADNSGAVILGNTDEDIVNNFNEANPKNSGSQLEFESRFECGNLRKAIHTGIY